MPDISRRGIIGGLICLVAAPAIVKVSSIMPVKSMPEKTTLELLRDEIAIHGHFDHKVFQLGYTITRQAIVDNLHQNAFLIQEQPLKGLIFEEFFKPR